MMTREDRAVVSHIGRELTEGHPRSPDEHAMHRKACRERGKSVLLEGVCLLIALATPKRRALTVLETVQQTCQAHSWVRVAVNHFEGGAVGLPQNPACVIYTAQLHGFKSRFWKRLVPDLMAGFTHLFLPDSDMAFSPSDFDMVAFVRISAATNVSILAPSPYGGGEGLFPLGDHAQGILRFTCGSRDLSLSRWRSWQPERRCAVCLHATVEVKAPLFTSRAWRVVHEHVYARAPDEVLVGDGTIDNMWCSLVGELVHGCKLPWRLRRTDPGYGRKAPRCLGQACAYSYVTPLRHLNDRTINTCKNRGAINYLQAPLQIFLAQHGLDNFKMAPTLRPPNTSLSPHSNHPCWDLPALIAKVPSLAGLNLTAVSAIAREERLTSIRHSHDEAACRPIKAGTTLVSQPRVIPTRSQHWVLRSSKKNSRTSSPERKRTRLLLYRTQNSTRQRREPFFP